MIKKLVIVALVASSGSISMADISVLFDGSDLVIQDGKQNFRFGALLDKRAFFGTIHAYQQRNQDYYIVYGTSEWSHSWSPGDGLCGCGIESYIRWLHIRDGAILEQQEGKYESCLLNRDGWTIRWENRKLIWNTEGSEMQKGQIVPIAFRWVYDSVNPALGIREHKTSIKAQGEKTPEDTAFQGQLEPLENTKGHISVTDHFPEVRKTNQIPKTMRKTVE